VLKSILEALLEINTQLNVLFPVHPRMRQRIAEWGLTTGKLHLLEPIPYLEFLALQRRATVIITDSGGVQEESTYLGVPCLTLRENTERPITVSLGTNTLVGQDKKKLSAESSNILAGKLKKGVVPLLWDGMRESVSRRFCVVSFKDRVRQLCS